MKPLATLLLLTTIALPLGGKWKIKEKRFDPVRVTDVRQVAGRYVGIDPDYVLQLQVSSDGTLSGTMNEFGVATPLRDLWIDGADLTARVGGLPIHATFVNRVRNGVTTFGLLVHDADVEIDDVTVSQIFCARVVAGS